ncbi:hypothetical protein TNCV_1922611 [Trichonephila clavipes]|nr:hypothetical protein TNCV_1922611 [Trichonephila clavipes]
MAFSLKTLISELEKKIVPGILQENASNLSSYKRRRLERLAGILNFKNSLKNVSRSSQGEPEKDFIETIDHVVVRDGSIHHKGLLDKTHHHLPRAHRQTGVCSVL